MPFTPTSKRRVSSSKKSERTICLRSKPIKKHCTRRCMDYWQSLLFFPPDKTMSAERQETNRSRQERRQLRLQHTSPEQVCFVAATQIGELRTRTLEKGNQ